MRAVPTLKILLFFNQYYSAEYMQNFNFVPHLSEKSLVNDYIYITYLYIR